MQSHKLSKVSSTGKPQEAQEVLDVLCGLGRHNKARLEFLTLLDWKEWKRFAEQELERRATIVIQALSETALTAIASGQIDMAEICFEVAGQIDCRV
jgi:hypothetical protein